MQRTISKSHSDPCELFAASGRKSVQNCFCVSKKSHNKSQYFRVLERGVHDGDGRLFVYSLVRQINKRDHLILLASLVVHRYAAINGSACHQHASLTRSSADADNGLDAFSSQLRSTNMVLFWVHCDFSLSK